MARARLRRVAESYGGGCRGPPRAAHLCLLRRTSAASGSNHGAPLRTTAAATGVHISGGSAGLARALEISRGRPRAGARSRSGRGRLSAYQPELMAADQVTPYLALEQLLRDSV